MGVGRRMPGALVSAVCRKHFVSRPYKVRHEADDHGRILHNDTTTQLYCKDIKYRLLREHQMAICLMGRQARTPNMRHNTNHRLLMVVLYM